MISYTIANTGHIEAIVSLLNRNNLPSTDIAQSRVDFIIASEENKLVGCIGIEKYESDGLLRSFAVEADYRNKGIGTDLYKILLDYARQSGIINLHLLTTTARQYFEKEAFKVENRNKAPDSIRKSKEFSSLCPSTSTYMVLENFQNIFPGPIS